MGRRANCLVKLFIAFLSLTNQLVHDHTDFDQLNDLFQSVVNEVLHESS